MLTQARLCELLSYNRSTGQFTWKESRGSVAAGTPAGTPKDGYLVIRIDKALYRAHRLAWLYETGEFPEGHLDHENNNRAINVFDNLRSADFKQNGANMSIHKDNTSGYKGVSWNKGKKKWQTKIKNKHIGYFVDPKLAALKYDVEAKRLDGEFACTNEKMGLL